MRTIRVEKPGNPEMLINKRVRITLFILLSFCLLFWWIIWIKKPSPLSTSFEVTNITGHAELYNWQERKWGPLERGVVLDVRDRIRTSKDGEVHLKLQNLLYLRLNENSEITGIAPRLFEKTQNYQLHLKSGSLLGASESALDQTKKDFFVSTPKMKAKVPGMTTFYLAHKPKKKLFWFGVLRGTAVVQSSGFFRGPEINLKSLEKWEVIRTRASKTPAHVTSNEWDVMKSAYSLLPRDQSYSPAQANLSRKTGNFFEPIFDVGTFYTPKIGYCASEFIEVKNTDEVYWNIEYDVFPRDSFVGVYLKTRDFDLSDYEGFRFEARQAADESYPKEFRVEFKSRGQIVRVFTPRHFGKKWEENSFKFSANRTTPISEITFVFSHEKVGEDKKGMIQIQKIELLPRKEKRIPEAKAKLIFSEPIRVEKVKLPDAATVNAARLIKANSVLPVKPIIIEKIPAIPEIVQAPSLPPSGIKKISLAEIPEMEETKSKTKGIITQSKL